MNQDKRRWETQQSSPSTSPKSKKPKTPESGSESTVHNVLSKLSSLVQQLHSGYQSQQCDAATVVGTLEVILEEAIEAIATAEGLVSDDTIADEEDSLQVRFQDEE